MEKFNLFESIYTAPAKMTEDETTRYETSEVTEELETAKEEEKDLKEDKEIEGEEGK